MGIVAEFVTLPNLSIELTIVCSNNGICSLVVINSSFTSHRMTTSVSGAVSGPTRMFKLTRRSSCGLNVVLKVSLTLKPARAILFSNSSMTKLQLVFARGAIVTVSLLVAQSRVKLERRYSNLEKTGIVISSPGKNIFCGKSMYTELGMVRFNFTGYKTTSPNTAFSTEMVILPPVWNHWL